MTLRSITASITNLPYAFTEQGIAMLSSVLRSKRAVRVNRHHARVRDLRDDAFAETISTSSPRSSANTRITTTRSKPFSDDRQNHRAAQAETQIGFLREAKTREPR